MSAVPDGWEVGARLRRLDGTAGVIVYMGKEWAVLDTGEDYDVLVSYYGTDWKQWKLVLPFPPIPEDVGTIVQHRLVSEAIAVRARYSWLLNGQPVPDWKPDPAEWQQLIPKEQQQ